MKEIIKIRKDEAGKETVNARELWMFLESKQQFGDWIKGRIKQYDFVENQDFTLLHNSMKPAMTGFLAGGHNKTEYHITIDMAKELSMVERNEKGRQARRYFIECEKKLQTFLPDFSNPAEAARAWAIEYEEKQVALLELQENKPKIDYYETVLDTDSTYTVTQIAKENEMTAVQLNLILGECGIQFKQSGQWLLYRKYQDKGLVKTRTHVIETPNGRTKTRHSTTWTEKGREFIRDLLETI